jgi:hypothetical protein
MKTPQYYVIRILPVFMDFKLCVLVDGSTYANTFFNLAPTSIHPIWKKTSIYATSSSFYMVSKLDIERSKEYKTLRLAL